MNKLHFHPAAAEFPLLDTERLSQLAEDIKTHGQLEPIHTHRGQIVDGRNRYLACQEAGIEPRVECLSDDTDPFAYVWSLNGQRRDLTQDQRYLIWKSCARKSGQWQTEQQRRQEESDRSRSEVQKGVPKAAMSERPSTTCGRSLPAPRGRGSSERAVASHTNRGAVERMDRLERERPDLAEKVRLGEITSQEAIKSITKPHVAKNSGDNEWYTPSGYVERAVAVMGGIDLDPASCETANQMVGATRFHAVEDDGLSHSWQGRVFMNPPYAQPLIQQFCEKLVEHHGAGDVTEAVVLVNNATETRWFQSLLSAASAVCFPSGRIRFHKPGKKSAAPLQGQAVIYLGKNIDRFTTEFKQFGRVCHVV